MSRPADIYNDNYNDNFKFNLAVVKIGIAVVNSAVNIL